MRTPTGFRWSPRAPSPRVQLLAWRVVVAGAVLAPFLTLSTPASADPIAGKQAEAARLAKQLQVLGDNASRVAEQYDQALLRVDQLNAKLAATRAGLGSTDGQLADARSKVRDLAVNTYMNGGTASELKTLLPQSTEELTIRNAYMGTIAGRSHNVIDSLRQVHLQLRDQQAQLASDQAAANKAVAEADALRRSASAADATERNLLSNVKGELAQMVASAQAQQQRELAARAQAEIVAREAAQASRVASTAPAGSSGGSPAGGRSGGLGTGSGPLPPPPPGAAGAIEEARRQLGKPYAYGGAGPNSFDCSGLTAWAWGHAGRSLPHSAAAQYDMTTHIPVSELQPGDLVFWGRYPHHVGIYVGGAQMINALHSGTNVEYDSIYMEGDLFAGRVN